MTDAIILHASLLLPVCCPSWQEPLLQSLPYAHRLELERRQPEARRASLAGLGLVLMAAARLKAADVVEGVIGHIAAKKQLTPLVEPLVLDDARMSALLERSLGLTTQFE
jgi:hypothetical protein